MPIGTRFSPWFAEPGKLFSSLGPLGDRCIREAPADFIALGGGTQLALLALSWRFKCAAAAHFLKDALAIQLRFKALESTVNGLSFFHSHSTHAMILGWFGWFRSFFGAR